MPALLKPWKSPVGPLLNTYEVLVCDFYHAPVVVEVDLSGYTGRAREFIRVRAEEGRIGAAEVRGNYTRPCRDGPKDREAEKRPQIVEVACVLRCRRLRKLSQCPTDPSERVHFVPFSVR